MEVKIKAIKGFRPLYVEPKGYIWASKNNKVFLTNEYDKPFIEKAKIENNDMKRQLLSSNRLSSRMFRLGFHWLNKLSNGNLIGLYCKSIVLCNNTQFKRTLELTRGRPLSLCMTPNNKLFFGEYFSNPDRDKVSIFGSFDGGEKWETVFTYPENSIRHIHGIYYDKYRNGFWILTGDKDQECRIDFADESFSLVETVVEGSQSARAVSVIPCKTGLIVPTDTPVEQNYIQWLDVKSEKLERLHPLPGSAFYTVRAGDYYVVSTVAEPSAVNANYAAIFISKDTENWTELYRQEKDIWPKKYFQYGALPLPAGDNPDPVIYAYGQALKQVDNHMLIWDLRENGN